MKFAIMALLILAAMGAAIHVVMAARFRARADGLAQAIVLGPPVSTAETPPVITDYAMANGAGSGGPARAVRLVQDAELQLSPDGAFAPMPAVQTIGLGAPGFGWFAEAPLAGVPKYRVIDAYVDGTGLLEARLFGSIRIAHAKGAIADRAEAMRYLAELPWVPDAMIGNPDIVWTQRDDGWVEAALDLPDGRVAVRFRFDGADIVEMWADARPDIDDDGREITRIWRGHFSEYIVIGDRRIPSRGEVGYVTNGQYAPYWRGQVTEYQILR